MKIKFKLEWWQQLLQRVATTTTALKKQHLLVSPFFLPFVVPFF